MLNYINHIYSAVETLVVFVVISFVTKWMGGDTNNLVLNLIVYSLYRINMAVHKD